MDWSKFIQPWLTLMIRASSVADLQRFTNLKTLILDHNNFTNMRYFPELPNLQTLSLAYNSLRDLDQALSIIHTKVRKLQDPLTLTARI